MNPVLAKNQSYLRIFEGQFHGNLKNKKIKLNRLNSSYEKKEELPKH